MNLSVLLPLVLASPLLLSTPPSPSEQATKPADGKPKAAPAAKSGEPRTIEITAGDDMKFSLTSITAKPGEQLRIRLKSTGTMPKIAMGHNFVVVKPATNVTDFANAAMMAKATDYIPPDKKADVLASTALVGPGETVEVTFKAPAAAGSYPFLCTFPGHFAAGMKGTLAVK
jgi:azurin